MARAKSTAGYGQGWHKQSLGHSIAKTKGKWSGANKYKAVTYPTHLRDKEGKPVSFNLYNEENIDFDQTKSEILDNFKTNHETEFKKIYSDAGLTIEKIDYYSPSSYNYQGDSIDFTVKISNKKKLLKFIDENETELQKLLDGNESSDGYIALTKNNVKEVKEEIEKDGEVDPMVVQLLNNKVVVDYDEDKYGHYVYDDD